MKDSKKFHKHLRNMANQMKRLVKKERWDQIDTISKIPNDIWSGPNADSYEEFRKKTIKSRDKHEAMYLPLTASCMSLQETVDECNEYFDKL